jgi:thioredoxin-dependent peroxiredoxin
MDTIPVTNTQSDSLPRKAPDFTAPQTLYSDSSQVVFRLADHKGQWIILYFYPKDDTSGCTQEAQDFQALLPDFAALGAKIVGVSTDSLKSHDKFKTKYGLNFPLIADEDKALSLAYGVWVEKSMYGRTYMGTERSTFLIDPSGQIVSQWLKVKVKDHALKVLDQVKALKSA